MGIGRGLSVGDGDGPLEAEFLGQPAEPDDGHFASIFAEEGIDETSETTETIHVGVHLLEFSLESIGRRRRGIFSFPFVSSHFRSFRAIGAWTMDCPGPGPGWIWVGSRRDVWSDFYYRRGALS